MSSSAGAIRRYTVAEAAERIRGEIEGDRTVTFVGVAPLSSAGPSELSWLGSEKYAAEFAESRAAAIVVPTGWKASGGPVLIRVADPDVAMCSLLSWLAPPPVRVAAGVHASAVIEAGAVVEGVSIGAHAFVGAGAVIGAGTQLHPGVYVGENAQVGRECVLYPGVIVRERVVLGDRVVIHSNSTIGADGFGYLQRGGQHVKVPQIGTVVVEDDVEIGANCAIDRARSGVTRIGRGAKIDNLVQIGHNCDVGEGSILVGQVGLSGTVTVGPYAMLGGQTGVADHVRIGRAARVCAQSGIMRDVPEGDTVMGTPAVGLRELMRIHSLSRKLPQMAAAIRDLVERVKQLESSADDTARG